MSMKSNTTPLSSQLDLNLVHQQPAILSSQLALDALLPLAANVPVAFRLPHCASPSSIPSATTDSVQPPDSDTSASALDGEISLRKIPKPEGEAGRPGRNGYNLHRKLKWDDDTYKCIKVYLSC